MSKEMGISITDIKLALGIPLKVCRATTIKQAKRVYDKAPSESEAKAAALMRWIELVTTVKEAKRAYDEACFEIETAAELAAIRKLATFFLKK